MDNPEMMALADLRSANIARQKEWDASNQITLAYRGNELAGEVGEACNVIKKLERERLGIAGSRDTVAHLAEELADVVICADLIAMHEGIDLLGKAVPAKFNATSEKVGLNTRLAAGAGAVKVKPLSDAQWLKKRTAESGVVLKNSDRTRFLENIRFAERHIVALIPEPAKAGDAVMLREALGWLLDAIKSEVKFTDAMPLLKRRFETAERALSTTAPQPDNGARGVPSDSIAPAAPVSVENIAVHIRMALLNHTSLNSEKREVIGDEAARALLDAFKMERK